MKFELIDLFCGAGGVTTGIENARHKKQKIADVQHFIEQLNALP